ncbi:sporulation protein SsgA, partial [Streptomyces sp. SID6041]|nr:sporulation protein SsgA [Streptomyces sp. SID6041]
PHRGAGGHEIRIGLGSPAENADGHAVLFAEARALKGFLRQTYDVVGEGEESMDVDTLLDEILAR